MALKAVIEKLEDVDEAIRPLYVAKDGKFQVDVEGLDGDPMALRRALQDQRATAGVLAKKVKDWEAIGKTPAEIQELAVKYQERLDADEKGGGQPDIEKMKTQMLADREKVEKALQTKLDNQTSENTKLRTALEQTTIDNALTAAIAAEKGSVKLLLKHARENVKMVEENGRLVPKVVDEKGTPRVNGKGDDLTIPELIAEMKSSEVFGPCFEGSGSSGSGSGGNNTGNGGSTTVKSKSEFKSEKERAAFIDKHGLPRYQALPN